MEATTTAVEMTLEIKDDDLLIDLETLTDAQLAQIGGGQAIIFL
jgi:hypothetical protein